MTSSIVQIFGSDPAPSNQGDIAGNRFVAVSNSATTAGNTLWCVCCIANFVGNVITGVKDSVNGAWTQLDLLNGRDVSVNDALSLGSFYFPNAAAVPAGDKGSATGGSNTTLVDSTKSWTTNQWAGFPVMDLSAAGATATVISNTATTLTFSTGFINPSAGHRYAVGGWVEIDVSGNDDYNASSVLEIAGVQSASLAGHNGTQQSLSSGTNNDTSGNAALGSSPVIILGFSIASENLTSVPGTGSGNTSYATVWTWDQGHANARIQYRNVSNPGTAGSNFNAGSTDFYQTVMASFLDANNSPSITPSAGASVFAGLAATLALAMTPQQGTVSFTGQAPTVFITSGRTITPTNASLNLTGIASNEAITVTPGNAGALWQGYIPSVSIGTTGGSITPQQAPLAFTGYAVSQLLTLPPIPQAVLSLQGYAPSVNGQVIQTPGQASLAFQGYAPFIQFPTLTGSVSWQGQSPPLAFTMGTSQGPLAFTGYAPVLSPSGLTIPAALAFTGLAPKVIGQTILTPSPGALNWTGNALGLSYVNPPTAMVSWSGLTPTITNTSSRPSTPRHYMQRFPVGTDGTVQCVDVTRAVPPFVFWQENKIDANSMLMIVVDGLPVGWDDGLQLNAQECIIVTRTPVAPTDWTNGLQLDSRGFLCVTDNPTLPVFNMQGLQFDVNGYLVVTIS